MTKANFIRASGWALVLGGVMFSWGVIASFLEGMRFYPLRGLGRFYEYSALAGIFYVGPILLAIGMLGLRARYGDEIGSLGKTVLLIGVISGATALPLAFLIEEIAPLMRVGGEEPFIVIFLVGLTLKFICLAFFGILVVRRKALPRWNGAPIVAGIWFPAALLVNTIAGFDTGSTDAVLLPTSLIMGVALILLGYTLQADTPKETAIA